METTETKETIVKRVIFHNEKYAIETEETQYFADNGFWYYKIGTLTFNVLNSKTLELIEQNKQLDYLVKKYF